MAAIGYTQWWLITEETNDYTAMGHLGQFLYVNPQDNVIIVRLGTSRDGYSWDAWRAMLASVSGSTSQYVESTQLSFPSN